MYRVILVDDEPVTFKSIRRVIETRCQGFEIAAVASNGREGLEIVRKLKPDIVITDVEMPVMDGITFAEHIKQEMPDVLVIILSGYQEFEYVRGAIKSGACDYLLKPIVPIKLMKVMERMKERLDEMYWQKRNQLMRIVCQGGKLDTFLVRKYFGDKKYYGVLIRKNGLPRRISINQEYELFSIQQEQVIMYARDVQEGLYLYPEELITPIPFKSFIERIMEKFQDGVCYLTVVSSELPFQIEQLAEKIKLFYRILAENTVVGKTQTFFLEDSKEIMCKKNESDEKADWFHDISRLLEKKKYEYIPEAVKHLLGEWRKKEKTQLWMESKVRQLFYLLISEGYLNCSVSDIEFAIEDAFFNAVSMEELEEYILAEVEKQKKEQSVAEVKMDTPEHFQLFREYIWDHMTDPLTLQQLCRHFGVSQPYVSRFFRKYEGTSFSNYLTEVRIKRAKELLDQNKEILIKDVAFMVGYNDQFYFSRIFRSIAGVSPTEYIKLNKVQS